MLLASKENAALAAVSSALSVPSAGKSLQIAISLSIVPGILLVAPGMYICRMGNHATMASTIASRESVRFVMISVDYILVRDYEWWWWGWGGWKRWWGRVGVVVVVGRVEVMVWFGVCVVWGWGWDGDGGVGVGFGGVGVGW